MGRHTTNAAAALHEPLAVTITGDAVTVGDYVRVEASGFGRRGVDGLSLATQNTAAGVTALTGLGVTAHVAAANYSGPPGRPLAVLGNGNVACLYTGDGTTASTALTCRVYSPIKAPVATVAVSAVANISSARVLKLGASNFAVCWSESATLKMAVYSNAGAVVLAAITIASLGGGSAVGWNATALVNGDLVVTYDKTASGGVFFSRYNASGVLQGAETTIEAASAGANFCALPLAAGGFWVYYYRSTSTAYKFARYNAAGVLQGALTTVFTGAANLSAGFSENYAIELSNGNVALVDPSVGTVSAVRLYDSAGTLLTTVTNNTGLGAGAGPNNTMIRAKSGGGFYIATVQGRIAYYDNGGTLLIVSATTISLGGGGTVGMALDRLATGPLFYYTTYDGSSVGSVNAIALDGVMVAEATTLAIQATTSQSVNLWAEIMPCGLLAFTFCSAQVTGVSAHGRLSPQAASVLGLAITAGTDGQAVSVATAGRWRANQTMPAVNFDRRSSSPVGCKAAITGGTTAVLLGIVA
ncbi:hypothetical protein [Acidovorax sp. A1169]|uniref:hypothetical protein n=1 Tax=Acidovorax sp. A1169 TaxID=3059524 RepID=UPI0027378319|nr:hypothetical protein [Acidovorax sp. A1169]MDP4076258.1 hypothetical protein [Acidovorax sp. A1169]